MNTQGSGCLLPLVAATARRAADAGFGIRQTFYCSCRSEWPCGNRPRGLRSEALVTHLIRSGRDFQPTRVTTKLGMASTGHAAYVTAQELKPEAALEVL
jgi:hypothetical protein